MSDTSDIPPLPFDKLLRLIRLLLSRRPRTLEAPNRGANELEQAAHRDAQVSALWTRIPVEIWNIILLLTMVPDTKMNWERTGWSEWRRGWLQCRQVCLLWFCIMDRETCFWTDIDGFGRWQWAALCVELSLWRNWPLRSLEFIVYASEPDAYVRDVLHASAMHASHLSIAFSADSDANHTLGDLVLTRPLHQLHLRHASYDPYAFPLHMWRRSGLWVHLQSLNELKLDRIDVPLAWLTVARGLRCLHMSWMPWKVREMNHLRRVDATEFMAFVDGLRELEELHVEGAFTNVVADGLRAKTPKLRDLKVAGYGRDIEILFSGIQVRGVTRLQVDIRSDRCDGNVLMEVGNWARGWGVRAAAIEMRCNMDYGGREYIATMRLDGGVSDTAGWCKVIVKEAMDVERDMAISAQRLLELLGPTEVEELTVRALPRMEIDEGAWAQVLYLSQHCRTLKVYWPSSASEGYWRPELHPVTRAFKRCEEACTWPNLEVVRLECAMDEIDVMEWVMLLKRRMFVLGGDEGEAALRRWAGGDLYMMDVLRKEGFLDVGVRLEVSRSRWSTDETESGEWGSGISEWEANVGGWGAAS